MIESLVEKVAQGWARNFAPQALRLANEARVEGATALYAADQASAEGDIQTAKQRAAWITQIQRLEGIYNRDLAQGLLLQQLRRNVRELDRTEQNFAGPAPTPRMGFLGAALGAAGPLSMVRPWMLWGGALASVFAWGGIQTARLNHAKHDLTQARDDLNTAQEQREAWKQRSEQYAQAVADAREVSRISTAQLEAERRRAARASDLERRRQREIQAILANSGDAPAWRLRDDEPPVS